MTAPSKRGVEPPTLSLPSDGFLKLPRSKHTVAFSHPREARCPSGVPLPQIAQPHPQAIRQAERGSRSHRRRNLRFSVDREIPSSSAARRRLPWPARILRGCRVFCLVAAPLAGVLFGIAPGGEIRTEAHRDRPRGNIRQACRDHGRRGLDGAGQTGGPQMAPSGHPTCR
jgi:hypothetical protein